MTMTLEQRATPPEPQRCHALRLCFFVAVIRHHGDISAL
jgi:hypothetical protein